VRVHLPVRQELLVKVMPVALQLPSPVLVTQAAAVVVLMQLAVMELS
jgi:hypothetical protein